jgi:BlaI family transcriptional regulator, penicillinase repressor
MASEVMLTNRELDLMAVLWDSGPSTAGEVQAALHADGENLAYTTVLTILRVLEEKGYARHRADGRAHRFRAVVTRRAAARSTIRRLVRRMFHGSREMFLAHLVSDGRVRRETLQRMRKMLKRRMNGGEIRLRP